MEWIGVLWCVSNDGADSGANPLQAPSLSSPYAIDLKRRRSGLFGRPKLGLK